MSLTYILTFLVIILLYSTRLELVLGVSGLGFLGLLGKGFFNSIDLCRENTHLSGLLGGALGLKELDEVFQGTSTVVVLHLATGGEELQSGEALDLDILEFVGSGVRHGNNDVFVILSNLIEHA